MAFFRKHPLICGLILLCIALLILSVWGTHSPQLTTHTITMEKLPASFDGLRILQVSDLHNAQFGKDNRKLLKLVVQTQPDIILLTGDLIDSRRTDPEAAIAFCKVAVTLAPTYYTPGNHESRMPETYASLKSALEALSVTILEDESTPLTRGNDRILITGLMDPYFATTWPECVTDDFQIVLSHRPELLEQYAQMGLDLVFSGHAHGGQFRLPFVGGLFAPHQGVLPQYTEGIHSNESTTMVVSRGLGNSLFPLRFNNRPELVLITLESV